MCYVIHYVCEMRSGGVLTQVMRWHRSSEDCLLNSGLKFQGRPNGQKNGAGVKQFNKYFGCLLISLQFFGSQRWNCNKFLSLYGFSSHRLWIPGLPKFDSKEVAFSGTILATDTPLSTFMSLSYVNKKYAIVHEFKTHQLAWLISNRLLLFEV